MRTSGNGAVSRRSLDEMTVLANWRRVTDPESGSLPVI
jgi:hypothetical protein